MGLWKNPIHPENPINPISPKDPKRRSTLIETLVDPFGNQGLPPHGPGLAAAQRLGARAVAALWDLTGSRAFGA